MHHSHCRSRALWLGGLLLALLACGRPEPSQAEIPASSSTAITVPTGTTTRLQMSTKKAIKLVRNSKENVLGIKKVEGDPTRIDVTGQDAGITHLELTDADDKLEGFDVVVQADVEFLRIQLKRLVPTGNIEPIPISNNVIILRGTVNHIEDVPRATAAAATAMPGMQIVSDLRVAGVQQVQLCVTVAQVGRNELRAMAFDFLTNSKNFYLASTAGGAVATPLTVGAGQGGATGLQPTLFGQTLAATTGSTVAGPTNLLFGVIHNRWGFLGFLNALRNEQVVKELNEPTITTESGRPASFLVGGEQAVPVPAGLGQVGVQFEEFGTRLNFVPIVLGNGKIHLEVEPEVSTLNAANGTSINGTVVPGRTTTRVNTTVELEDGQTFVIGGLVQREMTGTAQKTPVLGDLPFLGAAFRGVSYNETETEMVILVTPHLVDAEDCSQVPPVLPGEETRVPDDFELFLEGILEAPRGPREVFPDNHYLPAYKNGPTAALFPCAGQNGCGAGCNGGCNAGCGATSAFTPAHAAAPAIAPAAEAAKPMPMLMPQAPAQAAKPAPVEAATPAPAEAVKPGDAADAAPPIPMPPPPDGTAKPAASSALPADLPPAPAAPGNDGQK